MKPLDELPGARTRILMQAVAGLSARENRIRGDRDVLDSILLCLGLALLGKPESEWHGPVKLALQLYAEWQEKRERMGDL